MLRYIIIIGCIATVYSFCNKGLAQYENQFTEIWNKSQNIYIRTRPGQLINCYDVVGDFKTLSGGKGKDKLAMSCSSASCSVSVYVDAVHYGDARDSIASRNVCVRLFLFLCIVFQMIVTYVEY